MLSTIATGLNVASIIDSGGAVELSRGAIAGAFFVGAAFLAGFAVFRRGAMAVCALLMVTAAATLEFGWLGLFRSLPETIIVLTQGVFAATVIVFLSASVRAARNNAVLGGLMFAAALSFVGAGVINLLDRVDIGGLMTWGLGGVSVFALALTASQAVRGDAGARLILPGALLATAAAILAGVFGNTFGAGLAPHVLFTVGVLAASLVAFTESGWSAARAATAEPTFATADAQDRGRESADSDALSDDQLAQVLDYSGVAVWDWSEDEAHQTDSLPSLLGAKADSALTPESLRALVSEDDLPRFEKDVLGAGESGDGGFDVALKLRDGRAVRLRGARAINNAGALERVVAFAETAAADAHAHPLSEKVCAALANGEIGAAFQPIVALDGERIVGFEALARWPGKDNAAIRPEDIVRAAESAGKGAALASTMLDSAAAFLAEKMKSERRRDLFVALNVSYGQVREKGFVAAVRAAVDAHDLPAGALVLELTETEAITDPTSARQIFRLLKNAGVALAFDDFGAGFSSLSNLHKFDFDYLKIDRSFISELEAGGDAVKIARSMATLGKELGLKVIAEGVETKETARAAREIGCAYGQGFKFGVPSEPQIAPRPEPQREAAITADRLQPEEPPAAEPEESVFALETANEPTPAQTEDALDEAFAVEADSDAELDGDLELAEVSIIPEGATSGEVVVEERADARMRAKPERRSRGRPDRPVRDDAPAAKPRRLKFLGVPLI